MTQLELANFKAFERTTVSFGGDAFLVGPNNAGKSTVIEALRSCSWMIRHASSKPPSIGVEDRGKHYVGYPFSFAGSGVVMENLRHEFREAETRVEAKFTGGARLTAVWPAGEGDQELDEGDDEEDYYEERLYEYADETGPAGFFYLTRRMASQPRSPADVRHSFPVLGVVPLLSPIEHDEEILSWDYLRRNVDSRLASRHFRNQLHRIDDIVKVAEVDDPWQSYLDLVGRWLPEIRELELTPSRGQLDLYFEERGSRVKKEIYWAGDGIQIWLQLLLHLLRVSGCGTVVLDEPDVYLHPDLQRRLVRVLDSQGPQFITASHSAELLAEASGDRIVWLDKSRRRAVRVPNPQVLTDLSNSLGSQFNLRLARALRSKAVLFVEGEDMQILRLVAATLGALKVAGEIGMAQIPLQGFNNWDRTEPFEWLLDQLLDGSVSTFVVLDRDHRSASAIGTITKRMNSIGIASHVWRRTELENYLLDSRVMSRVSGAPEEWVSQALDEIADDLRNDVLAQMVAQRHQEAVGKNKDVKTVTTKTIAELDSLWEEPTGRLTLCPGKEVISSLNQRLQASGYKACSARGLAKEMTIEEIPDEMAMVIQEAEALA